MLFDEEVLTHEEFQSAKSILLGMKVPSLPDTLRIRSPRPSCRSGSVEMLRGYSHRQGSVPFSATSRSQPRRAPLPLGIEPSPHTPPMCRLQPVMAPRGTSALEAHAGRL